MSKPSSVHTSRTIMFAELERVMDMASPSGDYSSALAGNVFGKKSADGVKKTASFLKRLYGFDINNPEFIAFRYFWKISEQQEKPLLAFLYALQHDDLLAESIPVLKSVSEGSKVEIGFFVANLEHAHPKQYSPNTTLSMAQNIASSWKQAGFIVGKVKNIRSNPAITHTISTFAFLLAYLKGARGEFLWLSKPVSALCISENRLKELCLESAQKGFMQFQSAGSVTSISFSNLLNTLGIDGNQNRFTD